MYLDTARHHIDMALQKLTIEWPKLPDEINAKNNKLGIWQGKFEMPWDYRRKK